MTDWMRGGATKGGTRLAAAMAVPLDGARPSGAGVIALPDHPWSDAYGGAVALVSDDRHASAPPRSSACWATRLDCEHGIMNPGHPPAAPKGAAHMDLGVFIPIGSNGWLISTTSPRYKPSFALNRDVVQKAEALWLRVRAVDGQAAWLRRRERVLGPLPGKLHADGRPSPRSRTRIKLFASIRRA